MAATPLDQFDREIEMTFLDHIESLRWHLIRVVVAIFVFSLAAFFFNDFLFDTVFMGPAQVDFIAYKWFCTYLPGDMCVEKINFTIINTELGGQFTRHITTSVTVGLVFATPYLLYEIWRFVAPALSVQERKSATGIVFYGTFLFMLGLLFGYFLITPISVQFLGNYVVSKYIVNNVDIASYLDSVVMLSFSTALVFELPLVVYFLARAGIVTGTMMKLYRRYAIVIILFLSAIITPGSDVTSMMMLAIPFYGLYEMSIFIAKRIESRRKAQLV